MVPEPALTSRGPFEALFVLILLALPLLTVLGVVGLIVVLIQSARKTKSDRKGSSFSLGHATLSCPHCQQETTAGKPQCEHCGEDL